ncbi:MAG: hypothetical protein ACXVEE_18830 [Polyangiales bacterium]
MDVDEDPWNALLTTSEVLAVVRTDGSGGVVRASGVAPERASFVAERVDLCSGAVERLGAQLGIGRASVQLVDFEGGIVLSGARRSGHDVVIAGAGAKMGLLVSRLRRLLDAERGGEP